jgi:hypothetical protein
MNELMEGGTSFFLIGIVGGGVQLGPPSTSATNWPPVPAPGDYEDGEFILVREIEVLERKPTPVPLCAPQIPNDLTGCEPVPSRWETSD